MPHLCPVRLFFFVCCLSQGLSQAKPVVNVAELRTAADQAGKNAVIELAAGRFDLREPLVLQSGTTLRGAGLGKTLLTHAPEWRGNPATLPDPETNQKAFDRSGYLIHLADKAEGVTISGFTLTGPQLHGVIWINEPFAGLEIHHNHIIARTTATPRTEGLFGFHKDCDFTTFRFSDNIVECEGTPRPLFRNDSSGGMAMENNSLVNISDNARYENKATGEPVGPGELKFQCGVDGEISVDGWTVRDSAP